MLISYRFSRRKNISRTVLLTIYEQAFFFLNPACFPFFGHYSPLVYLLALHKIDPSVSIIIIFSSPLAFLFTISISITLSSFLCYLFCFVLNSPVCSYVPLCRWCFIMHFLSGETTPLSSFVCSSDAVSVRLPFCLVNPLAYAFI